jgi:segregation and condensation protein A
MSKNKHTDFKLMLGPSATRLETVVTFLALLELIKRYRVSVTQEAIFGDIEIERADDWNLDEEFELEFE